MLFGPGLLGITYDVAIVSQSPCADQNDSPPVRLETSSGAILADVPRTK